MTVSEHLAYDRRAFLGLATVLGVGFGQQPVRPADSELKALIEAFLSSVQRRDSQRVADFFTPKALVLVSRPTQPPPRALQIRTAEEWIRDLALAPAGHAQEVLDSFELSVEDGSLIHVRARFHILEEGRLRSQGVNHFVLAGSTSSGWKLAMLAFTSRPA